MTDALRYLSQMVIPGIGETGQQKISEAKVLVVGAGGLGCPVLTYLVAMGVGTVGIIDDDTVQIQNLHRQVLYSTGDIGKLKVAVAAEKLLLQNPQILITPYADRVSADNAVTIISNYDIVIDCCDNTITRYLIDTATRQLNKPFVYGAVLQYEGQLSVFNYKKGPAYSHLFPPDSQNIGQPDCSIAGIMGFVTGAIGCMQVNEVLKLILQSPDILSGYLMTFNFLTGINRKLKIKY